MKHFTLYLLIFLMLPIASCGHKEQEFTIHGTTSQDRLNGQLVFLVPYGSKEIEDSIGVDSVVIQNNEFHFRGTGEYLARVTIHKKHRFGTQDLLIVTENSAPIQVVIDSVSVGHGTPQNEALQLWKELLERSYRDLAAPRSHVRYLQEIGDTAYANALRDSIKTYNENLRQQFVGIAKSLGHGPAYDLLINRYDR